MMKKGGLAIETFDYTSCKPLLDDVDCLLASHFKISADELDFLLSYDLPYRIGVSVSSNLHQQRGGKRLRNELAGGV
jgi:hypothetical protein